MSFKLYLAHQYALSVNTLSVAPIQPLLSRYAVYSSEDVLEKLYGRDKVLGYLRRKYDRQSSYNSAIAELALAPFEEQRLFPCVLIFQVAEPQCLVRLVAIRGKIGKVIIHRTEPSPHETIRIGWYPGRGLPASVAQQAFSQWELAA